MTHEPQLHAVPRGRRLVEAANERKRLFLCRPYQLMATLRSDQGELVAHHGIQRSGTNYLHEILMLAGYSTINRFQPSRDDPRHKHFRWQDDKMTIAMDARYLNDLHVDSVAQINALCRYPASCHHIVIRKEPVTWLNSIYRWGFRYRWFTSDRDFKERELAKRYLEEWCAYYEKWVQLASESPHRVAVIDYEDMVAAPQATVEKLRRWSGATQKGCLPNGGRIERVAESPQSRPVAIDAPIEERELRYLVSRCVHSAALAKTF